MNSPKLKLGMIGLSQGNGHPYSWSAIINGYESNSMEECGFPVIPRYLEEQRWPDAAIDNASVSHIWTQDSAVSRHIAKSTYIPNIVEDMSDMIGQVDAVLLARDDAENHLKMAKPFIEAGLPIYIDKPITFTSTELKTLLRQQKYPGQIFSCSALRYAKEFSIDQGESKSMGRYLYAHARAPKDWNRYSIHVIDPLIEIIGEQGNIIKSYSMDHNEFKHVTYIWESGFHASISSMGNSPAPISMTLIAEDGVKEMMFKDTFSAFKSTLLIFINNVINAQFQDDSIALMKAVEMIERGNKSDNFSCKPADIGFLCQTM